MLSVEMYIYYSIVNVVKFNSRRYATVCCPFLQVYNSAISAMQNYYNLHYRNTDFTITISTLYI